MRERLTECLRIALAYHVSDIHFSFAPGNRERVTVEMRIGQEMKRLKYHPDDLRLFYYLMYRANLDISDSMEPQTGSFEETVDRQRLSLRFAVVSSYHMTSGVLRLLNNHPDLKIEELTYDPEQTAWFAGITEHRNGLFIFSGPTGSGKTTSLYTLLNACENKKIFTLEDPVEVVNNKYIQLQINERAHLSYAEGIKQLMRQDPDIIMVGEIRDSTAAEMAVRCALTGHLVVTSLHSFSCKGAIERMKELGVSPLQLQDVLLGVSCQRLYTAADQRKIGIYEIMDRKEVQHYFRTHTNSENFVPLAARIYRAVEEHIIEGDQAKADLIDT